MATLRIENTVRDFAEWKAVFDKFDRFRADHGVRSYRMYRRVDEPNRLAVDLQFDTSAQALTFGGALEQIWRTPQSKEQLVGHTAPVLFDIVEDRQLTATVASTA